MALVCNDEGKLIGLDLNRGLRDENGEIYDIVAGTFLVVGLGEEDFSSLSPELIQKYTEQFKTPERFMQINGNIVVLPVPAEKQDLAFLPDRFETGERVQTPRGSFQVTTMSREQMETAGYGIHHISNDGKYLIMGNGTRAFAVAVEQPEKDNPLRTAEMTLEDDYGMIDGSITIFAKNVFTAASRVSGRVWSLVRITVPNDLKSVRIRGRKTQNKPLYPYFQREPL